MSNQTQDKMFTPLEVAEYLKVSEQTVYRYLKGEGVETPLPSYKISRKNVRIKKTELDEWIIKTFNENTPLNNSDEGISEGGEQ